MNKYRRVLFSFLLIIVVSMVACRSRRDGTIEGSIIPPSSSASARISVAREGKEPLTVSADGQDGRFKVALSPGTYSVTITVPQHPSPLRFDTIVVREGETTTLPPVNLTSATGTGALTGKISPARSGAEVKLIQEGQERASVHTDPEGRYEFKELPAGSYEMRAKAPGHADDAVPVVIADNQNVRQDTVLLPIVSINGVDWTSGKIRATGMGLPPRNAPNKTVSREMAKRAALTDAERNLLRIVEQIRIDADRDVRMAMSKGSVATRIQGFIKGYSLVSERELEGGKIEVILELPLSGPSGLSRQLTE